MTFLFSDIDGSTKLLRELGSDQYSALLDDHRRVMRAAFQLHGGIEQGTEGDSFFVVFATSHGALAAAMDAQKALATTDRPSDLRVHVRMGIHTGEARKTPSGYVGLTVHRAARIAAAGHGDQTLVSQATVEMLRDSDVAYRFVDLGLHRLKDLSDPQRIYQLEPLESAGPRKFPPLRTLEHKPTNLPTQDTPLIGRDSELAAARRQLEHAGTRLLTLTGPGGAGKTRMALQLGAELLDEFSDGVFFVDLSSLTSSDLVSPAIAASLSINELAGQSLAAFLAGKKIGLVIDNFEHVMDAAAALGALLREAPGLVAVVTSREPLRITGERVHPVPPLDESAATALFVERAQGVNPDFQPDEADSRAVTEICRRLDGLPLAIELAAARISTLPPQKLLDRLEQRLKVLTSGARDVPARQQTLRDTIAWSYDLLAADEQRLFARLSVFAGPFDLESAESICDADLDTVAALVDKSLLRATDGRYSMLETIHEYAAERLAESADANKWTDRHAAFFAKLAEANYADRIVREAELSAALREVEPDLRSALDRLMEREPAKAVDMAASLGWFWHVTLHLAEGRARLDAAVAVASSSDLQRARALAALGEVASWQGDTDTAKAAIEEAVTIFDAHGMDQAKAFALYELGWGLFVGGDDEGARSTMNDSLEIQRRLGDELLINRAQLGLLQMLVAVGDVETVEHLAPESLDASRRLKDPRGEHFAHHFLADAALIRGDAPTAEGRYREALRAALVVGDRIEIVFEVQGVAMSKADRGHAEAAVRLAGAAQAELDALGADVSGVKFWNALQQRFLGPARAALGEDEAQRVESEGRTTGLDAVIAEALKGE